MHTLKTRKITMLEDNASGEPDEISELRCSLEALEAEVQVTGDPPAHAEGEWWVDVTAPGFSTAVVWRPGQGFGIFSMGDDGLFDRPSEFYRRPQMAANRLSRQIKEYRESGQVTPMGLRGLRSLVGIKQEDIARKLNVKQGSVSKFENRCAVKLETIEEYVRALGGKLILHAVFEDFEVELQSPSQAAALSPEAPDMPSGEDFAQHKVAGGAHGAA